MSIAGLKCAVGGMAFAVAASVAVAAAQADRFETKLPFKIDQPQELEAKVGPVRITSLKVTNLGRGYGRGGIGPKGLQPSELSTTLRLALDVSNPGEDWVVHYTIEFLDKSGKAIDKVTKREGYEEESKITNVDHPILEYVIPMISELRVTITGRLD